MSLKTAFYPCCAADVEEPLKLLQGLVKQVVFCDMHDYGTCWSKAVASIENKDYPQPIFIIGDAREVVTQLDRIDVLFYRCDSTGEGGSGLMVLGDAFMSLVLAKMSQEGGFIIADGSNSWNHLFGKINRLNGYTKFGWYMRPTDEQPFEDYNLRQIAAIPARTRR